MSGIAGVLIFSMVCFSVLSDIINDASQFCFLMAGICSWLAALFLLLTIGVVALVQVGVIAFLGGALLLFAFQSGTDLSYTSIIGKNASLISMIASVGFLRLIALSDREEQSSPRGAGAFFKTVLGVSLFGSVINISAPILFADKLYAEGQLGKLASSTLTRVFSGCSAWSPFFGGMAAVLTYVPDVQLTVVMAMCLPFAVAGLLLVCFDGWYFKRHLLSAFYGYPVRFNSLWIPVALSLLVIALVLLAPKWSILTCISVAALSLTFLVLFYRYGMNSQRQISQHILIQLPKMVNELVLFLTAGVLAEGLGSVIASGQIQLPSFHFGAVEASLLLVSTVVVSAVGVHPVVVVAGFTPLLLVGEPRADMLAVVYLFAWSLGTCASPLSGTHLVFQGRYGIPGWRGALWNWPYVGAMLLFSVPYLFVVDALL